MSVGAIPVRDPLFHEGGDCELREHLPAPWEEVDGVTVEYHNHPRMFVQQHIRVFEAEWRHCQRYKESMHRFSDLNLRWMAAEDWYGVWRANYQADLAAEAMRNAKAEP